MRKYLVAALLTVLMSFAEAQTTPKDSACAYLKAQNDTLKTKLFLANYKIEKVRYYLKIINRNPSQKKYVVGWVTRAIE